jgi:hypothetical protein
MIPMEPFPFVLLIMETELTRARMSQESLEEANSMLLSRQRLLVKVNGC